MGSRLGSLKLARQTEDLKIAVPPSAVPSIERLDGQLSKRRPTPSKSRQGDEIARTRAELLDRVARGELSVRQACREANLSRARFYQLRSAYLAQGIDGLRPATRARPDLRLPHHVESAIVAYALLNPHQGERSISRALAQAEVGGFKVSRHGVGEVLRRNGLSQRAARLARASTPTCEAPAAAVAVEPSSFANMYEHYRGYVYKVCLQRLGDPTLAEDATQETFVRVYTNIARYDSQRSILPWLKTIAVNLCIDMHRRDGRVSVKDPTDVVWSDGAAPDEPLDSVVSTERRTKLQRALKSLPAHQRRALLLYALEGWHYADIASAEEVSLQAIKSRVYRARTNLRKRRESGMLGLVFARVRTARNRAQKFGARFAGRLETALPSIVANLHAVEHSAVALIVSLAIGFSAGGVAMPPHDSRSIRNTQGLPTREAHRSDSSALDSSPIAAVEQTKALIRKTVDPTENASPENTQFETIVPSPNFRRDHTIFAAGSVSGCVNLTVVGPRQCHVLFRSLDGGATWTRLVANNLAGSKVVLPPGYPKDNHIYVLGNNGLQVSTDGGASFTIATPFARGSISIAPDFSSNPRNRRILIATPGTVMEYWPDGFDDSGMGAGVTLPARLILAPRTSSNVTFVPVASRSAVVFVGSEAPDAFDLPGSVIERCVDSICQTITIPGRGNPQFAFSPSFERDGLMFAFTGDMLFRSVGAGDYFELTDLPARVADNGGIKAVFIQSRVRNTQPILFSHFSPSGDGGLYQSLDGASTWTPIDIRVRGFEFGAGTIAEPAPGRLLVAGASFGLACSLDGGKTWFTRCR